MKSFEEEKPVRINLALEGGLGADESTADGALPEDTQTWNGEHAVREQLILMLNTMPDAVLITNLDGTVTDMNSVAGKMLRIESAQGIRRNIAGFLPGLSRPLLDRVVEMLRNGRAVIIEGFARTADGADLSMEVSISLCGENAGELCLLFRDTQYQRKIEETIAQMQRRMARAECLETAGTVSGQIAHDFNNLLTPLLAYPGLIRRELADGSPAMEFLAILEKTAEDMSHMTQQLLALSRRGNVGDDVFDPNSIVRHVYSLLKNSALPENIVLKTELADDLLTVHGGGDQMLRVLQNLCQNAVDAMDETGGILCVSTENVYLEEPVGCYAAVAPGEYVCITVRDTGPGIPEEIRAKIFDPFFTTKRLSKRRGSGLGLSIVHGVIKDHKGYVDLESELGKGSTFTLYLPVYRSPLEPTMDPSLRGHAEKILVVDDDPSQLRIIVSILKALNYEADGVARGEEAVDRLCRQPDVYDLLIVDMCLEHGMDGLDTWLEIVKIRPDMLSVLISGFSRPLHRVEEAQRAGAGAYVKKPLTVLKLGMALRQAFQLRRQQQTAVPPAADQSAAGSGALPASVATPRILLVDDEAAIRRLFSMILKAEIPHAEISQASNGAEALAVFREKTFDVVIMDLHMPVMDGRQAFVQFRAHCEDNGLPMPPVIFCTGFALPEFLKSVVSENGPHMLLRKPVRPDVLVKTILARLETR